jgi:hypothetical protein
MNREAIRKIANELLSTKVITVGELFETEFAKIAMTTGELVFRTSQKSIKYAKGCVATSKINNPHIGRWTFSVKCHQTKSKGPYDVKFRLLKGKANTIGILGKPVEISCNCNAWKYNGADFNSLQQDYNERQYSNGQPAHVRDPQRRYLICKHVAASVPLFKRFLIPDEFKQKGPQVKTPLRPGPQKLVQPSKTVQKTIRQVPKGPIGPIKPVQKTLSIPTRTVTKTPSTPSRIVRPTKTVTKTPVKPVRENIKPNTKAR